MLISNLVFLVWLCVDIDRFSPIKRLNSINTEFLRRFFSSCLFYLWSFNDFLFLESIRALLTYFFYDIVANSYYFCVYVRLSYFSLCCKLSYKGWNYWVSWIVFWVSGSIFRKTLLYRSVFCLSFWPPDNLWYVSARIVLASQCMGN